MIAKKKHIYPLIATMRLRLCHREIVGASCNFVTPHFCLVTALMVCEDGQYKSFPNVWLHHI